MSVHCEKSQIIQKFVFIIPFPGQNKPQTFIAHSSDVNTVHDDIDKIKTMTFGFKYYFR